jgi:hypothetical protein
LFLRLPAFLGASGAQALQSGSELLSQAQSADLPIKLLLFLLIHAAQHRSGAASIEVAYSNHLAESITLFS